MVKEVDRAERARQEQMKEKPKEPLRPKPKESDFNEVMRQSRMPIQPAVTKTELPSKAATEYAIQEAVKQEDRRGDEQKRDDRDKKEDSRDSRQEGKRADGRGSGQKVVAKGKMKQGGGQSGGGKRGGFGMESQRKEMARILKKSGVKSLPMDLRGKFASKLSDAMKTRSASRAQLTQQVINRIIQYVRVGINTKGEKEMQIELHERIFRGLKLRVIARGGKVGVIFRTSDTKGREVLEKNRDGLSKALKDKGIEVDEIEIT